MRTRLVRYLAALIFLALPFAQAQVSQSEAAPTTSAQKPEQKAKQADNVLIYARSDTVYMKSATIRSWLQRQPEFGQLRLAFTTNQGQADYYVEVTRPVFTWDWTYCVVKTRSGKVVGSGKVTEATAERAAKALAPRVIRVLYGETSASGRLAAAAETATSATAGGILPKRFVAHEELARRFESVKTFSVHSSTVWFEASDLEKALNNRPEFLGWGYVVATPQRPDEVVVSDLVIEVNRPLFTWDWTFSIQEASRKKSLTSGKVTAISGPAAAPMLAKLIVGTIADARGLPPAMQRQFDQALAETKVRSWELRHISGQTHLESGKKIKLAVGQNTVFARAGDDILFSVPVEDLLQFSYSSNVRDRSVKWFEAWEKSGNFLFSNVGDDPNSAAGALMVALPMLAIEYGVGGLLKGTAKTEHFLVLDWKDVSGVTTATLQGSESDVREICNELQKFSKASAVDLDAAAEKKRSALQEGVESTSYSVEIDQNVSLENTILAPGRYRVVILQREKNLAEVYFLNGSDNSIAARTLVEYARRSDPDRSTRISFRTVSGLQTFEEIQIEEHVLRFSPVPVFLQEV